jgi:hypothetical protein
MGDAARILAAVILTPDQRVRVFVSSTLEELAEERAAARRAIENLRLTPVMFELGARPHPPREDTLAARLSAAAESGAEAAGAFLPPLSGNRVARLSALRERMGNAFEAEQEAGRATPLEDAAAEARAFARG